jgi:hypothetical protein
VEVDKTNTRKIEPCHKKFGRLLKCFGFFTN